MSPVPERPKLYHITHVDNLATIVRDGVLLCDATIAARGGPGVTIGMSEIKRRLIEEISVSCHPGTKVGDYVPFYFCPRSVMLYLLHRANHPDLTYLDGQDNIVHLEADLHEVVAWPQESDLSPMPVRGMSKSVIVLTSSAKSTGQRYLKPISVHLM